MQWHQKPPAQRKADRWKRKRNRIVSQLLAKNPHMLSYEALARANKIMKSFDKPKPPRNP